MGSIVRINPSWNKQYRIIPSKYPPIDLFENCCDPNLLDALYKIEAITNPRIKELAGALNLVREEDRIIGVGSSPVMAAFTHVSTGRFTDGNFGAYYAANSLKSAIAESSHARAGFLSRTKESPGEIDMRVYIGQILKPLVDVRGSKYTNLHNTNDWSDSQAFAREAIKNSEWGILYRSVRHSGGECIAALRPSAVSIPKQGPHLSYSWDGEKITHSFIKRLI